MTGDAKSHLLQAANIMKTRILKVLALTVGLAALPLVVGWNPQSADDPQSPSATTQPESAPAVGADTNVIVVDATLAQSASNAPAMAAAALAPTPAEQHTPPNIRPSSPLADIVKLAKAGMEPGVMITYVTNSTSIFGLGSDEIIYLNDLGVPNEVITTIIEHDRAMREYWANAAQAQNAAVATPPPTSTDDLSAQNVAAPTYINPPAEQPVDAGYSSGVDFYDTLAPYGSWVDVDGYGPCWQPTVVLTTPGWAPYWNRGHWIYSDCGWYWLSDYSWGWAPFHYGRWFHHGRWGWCWRPDNVWGPSWVTWRFGGDYCGWAPLPPGAAYRPGYGFSFHGRPVEAGFNFGVAANWYNFVPARNFTDPHPDHFRVAPRQFSQVFANTTVVNDFGVGKNNVLVNHGIPPERVALSGRNPIPAVTIRDSGGKPGRASRGEQLGRDGRTLTVYRPPAAKIATAGQSTDTTAPGQPQTGTRVVNLRSQGISDAGRSSPDRPAANTRTLTGGQTVNSTTTASSPIVIGRGAATMPTPGGYRLYSSPTPAAAEPARNTAAGSEPGNTANRVQNNYSRPAAPYQAQPAAPTVSRPAYSQSQASSPQSVPTVSRSIQDRSAPQPAAPAAQATRSYAAPTPQYSPAPANNARPSFNA